MAVSLPEAVMDDVVTLTESRVCGLQRDAGVRKFVREAEVTPEGDDALAKHEKLVHI